MVDGGKPGNRWPAPGNQDEDVKTIIIRIIIVHLTSNATIILMIGVTTARNESNEYQI